MHYVSSLVLAAPFPTILFIAGCSRRSAFADSRSSRTHCSAVQIHVHICFQQTLATPKPVPSLVCLGLHMDCMHAVADSYIRGLPLHIQVHPFQRGALWDAHCNPVFATSCGRSEGRISDRFWHWSCHVSNCFVHQFYRILRACILQHCLHVFWNSHCQCSQGTNHAAMSSVHEWLTCSSSSSDTRTRQVGNQEL